VTERKMVATLNGTTPPVSHLDASLSPFLNQLTVGLGEQIKVMASEAAAAVVAKEKESILNEFRAHLQDEATKTLERVIAASKEQLASRALKELHETHEVAAQVAYEHWIKKIDQDLESFTTKIQESMNSSRREAVEQFRSQAAPVLGETQAALRKLATVQDQLKINLVTMCQQFEEFLQQSTAKPVTEMREKIAEFAKQFENNVDARVAAAHSAAVEIGHQLESLTASAAEQAAKVLKESTAEISRQSLSELETRMRKHLEFISESIAEIAKKGVMRPSD
jgi:hypothetical protein